MPKKFKSTAQFKIKNDLIIGGKEIEYYLKEKCNEEEENPLNFWKQN